MNNRIHFISNEIKTYDILNEIEQKGRLRDITIGGYVKNKISKPPIFNLEELAPNCKFVSFKVHFISENGKERLLTKGEIVAYVPEDLEENDFYEFSGTLSLAGFDYTRVVTMMRFKKKPLKREFGNFEVDNGNTDSQQDYKDRSRGSQSRATDYIWEVHPVSIRDLDLNLLSKDLYEETLEFIRSPLSYTHKRLEPILEPKASTKDTDKFYYDFSIPTNRCDLFPHSVKDRTIFEKENNYLIDTNYDIIREGLEYPILVLNISDFGKDTKLLDYAIWLVDDEVVVLNSESELSKHEDFKGNKIILSNDKIEGYPYLELKKGEMISWGL
ncbi:hypothetical protein COF68_04790 [Bacillus toyonensis]|uniref:hypothetical protein n=1 Tax=Bacillus toyonensis TaxID=155322 RepID=UPI000BFDB470|nr:hypothetical protein [Bacillus toyonensis]PHE64168.1 hypothetical protein COF68_04790 [Bacillus toyonensis]